MTIEDARRHAEAQILKDLVDALFAEHMFAGVDAGIEDDGAVWRWWLNRAGRRSVTVPVRPGIVQVTEMLPGERPMLHEAGGSTALDALSFMRLLGEHVLPGPDHERGLAVFRDMLADATAKATLSFAGALRPDAETTRDGPSTFLALERWASLRDRPFHPVGKAKPGFGDTDYRRYMAEFGAEMTLDWVAVPRAALRLGDDADPARPPAESLLDAAGRAAIAAALRTRGLEPTHVAIPLHNWQRDHALMRHLGEAVAAGTCVPLDTRAGRFAVTSSLRSLAPPGGGTAHLKLPLAVHSLAASRYLPAVKMINGQRSERLLHEALTRDRILAGRTYLCAEGDWWAYLPDGASLYDEAPRHLSAMVRRYPAALVDDPAVRMVPMAALGIADADWHYFDVWLRDRGAAASPEAATGLFRHLVRDFLECLLRLFRLGLLPEAHGQNALVVIREGDIRGFLFRDHDSLRLYVPWLMREGLADPRYEIKPGHANTLYHDTPEALLFWLQTLAVQVNLRAILESVALRYGVAERALWDVARAATGDAIAAIHPDRALRRLLEHELLDRADWPLKHLVRPIIARAGGPGSMPFGSGRTVNPFAPGGADAVRARAA